MKNRLRKIDLNNIKVARSETARDMNRRIVLNLVRRHQPISRAALARRSGMQRSTVSAITEQLIADRWVLEGAVAQLPRGRKPTFLHLNSDRAGIIGVDIQPHVTTLAVSTMDSRFLAQEQISTGTDPAEFIVRLGRRVIDLTRASSKCRSKLASMAVTIRWPLRRARSDGIALSYCFTSSVSVGV